MDIIHADFHADFHGIFLIFLKSTQYVYLYCKVWISFSHFKTGPQPFLFFGVWLLIYVQTNFIQITLFVLSTAAYIIFFALRA